MWEGSIKEVSFCAGVFLKTKRSICTLYIGHCPIRTCGEEISAYFLLFLFVLTTLMQLCLYSWMYVSLSKLQGLFLERYFFFHVPLEKARCPHSNNPEIRALLLNVI